MPLARCNRWGATASAIDHALSVADKYDVQVALHADTLNEGGFMENTMAAIKNRVIHMYHTEGAGGGQNRWIQVVTDH